MDAEKLEQFRQLLQEEMKALLSEADKTVHEMGDEASHFPDPMDRATQESDRNLSFGFVTRNGNWPTKSGSAGAD